MSPEPKQKEQMLWPFFARVSIKIVPDLRKFCSFFVLVRTCSEQAGPEQLRILNFEDQVFAKGGSQY
jgi:hypothetical protein